MSLASERGSFQILTLGAMLKMRADQICGVDFCEEPGEAKLAQQHFCIGHFIELCYENLQRIDPRGAMAARASLDPASMRAFIEECSRQALEVALRCEDLGNLERGRLLDILLWAGELFLILRAPRRSFADFVMQEQDPVLTRLAARHS